MKIITKFHIGFYLCLVVFICLIPNNSTDANIFKIILLLLAIGIFIGLATLYTVISFNRKYAGVKLYSYVIVILMFLEGMLFLPLGHTLYQKTGSIMTLILIMVIFFITTNIMEHKVKAILAIKEFDLMKETKIFLKMGHRLEEDTPLLKIITKLDYFFYGFCIGVFIAEDIYTFSAIVGLILLLSIKPLNIIKGEFLKSGLMSKKETYFSLICYYLCYLISIVWFSYFPNLSALLVGSVSLLAIKIYIHRIAKKKYDDENV